ncbi:3-deoxy-manno-octulosonate cytidylyltransferase [Chloropicon primus]|uniref:3-deoxy-manno-octulosonate cytidylyltransferase n=1 Tax=Chloropicon primus TaxID=1764295 RepID=A0A5B8MGF1_9CHLO|nr:3-deoxy-manno-octulosonate cytidylyltransferase [Chloropicon primus]UPQ98714.1 3-deoxy-manno-octulosonate cytidylyltransferase [Chloropicon primus]|eukprot:QDZ19503.1 3-deoxy-manno-octulosonate cytidylyltransferase [Chloropicon primus]
MKLVVTAIVSSAATAAFFLKDKFFGKKKRTKVIGVIPARYASTRFPGKPLTPILGKPMIVRTYEQAKKATQLDRVIVATDDDRIAKVCKEHGAEVVMTSVDCPNGTERCNEAVSKLKESYDIVVNIQGDEPLIEPEIIDEVAETLKNSPDAVYSTPCTPLKHDEVELRQRVKCITDQQGYAIYFSRGVIPHNKKGEIKNFPEPFQDKPYLLHLGLQCYDRNFLRIYNSLPATPLMLTEDLEQLKVIEHGYKIKVIMVNHCAHGVDEPEDVPLIEAKIKELGLE